MTYEWQEFNFKENNYNVNYKNKKKIYNIPIKLDKDIFVSLENYEKSCKKRVLLKYPYMKEK